MINRGDVPQIRTDDHRGIKIGYVDDVGLGIMSGLLFVQLVIEKNKSLRLHELSLMRVRHAWIAEARDLNW